MTETLPAPTAEDVRVARERALRGGDPARWPDKLPVRDRLPCCSTPAPGGGRRARQRRGRGLPADGVLTGVGRSKAGRSPSSPTTSRSKPAPGAS